MQLPQTALTISWAIVGALAIFHIGKINGLALRTECTDDYSPCTCTQEGVDVYVTCTDIQPADIKEMLGRTSYPVLKQVEIFLPSDSTPLPVDVLNRKVAEYIKIHGHSREDFLLDIDFGAFTPSKNKATIVEITDADLNLLNFGFLDGFVKLRSLSLKRASGVRVIKDIRLLESLEEMYINECLGFTEFTEFPSGNFPILKILHLNSNQDLDDDKLSIILAGMDVSPARETLFELFMEANILTRVPLRLPNFPALERVSMRLNTISYLQASSVGSSRWTYFNVQNNQLANIEPDAFVGDFGTAEIKLDFNNLTFFYEPVYKPLLQSMATAAQTGNLSISSNPINCDCTIAWLVTREQALLQYIDNQARCSNGQLFTQLDENAYALCP